MSPDDVVFHERSEWAIGEIPIHSPADKQSEAPSAKMYVHHSAGFSLPIRTITDQKELMRSFWQFHVKDRGWADIAYSFVVFPPHGKLTRAHIYVGRDFGHIPASQVGCNTGNWSACAVGNYDVEKPAPQLLHALHYLRTLARAQGIGAIVRGHRDCGHATECPGKYLYAALRNI